jgi:hypothetical protein
MKRDDARRLAIWIAALAAPLAASLIFYVVSDPFSVLHRPIYGPDSAVSINRDFASTELYLRGHEVGRYDSFIFGNSRALAFMCEDWTRAMQRPDARCFHFDAWKESLYGVDAKVRLIDSLGGSLTDVLVVLDGSLLAGVDADTGPAFRKHPRLTSQSWIGFQVDYLVDFYSNHFCLKYLDYSLFGRTRPYMGALFNAQNFTHRLDTNDQVFKLREQEIAREGDAYWSNRPAIFGPRTPSTSPVVVLEPQRRLLDDLAATFRRHGTRVRIVVSPLYDQIRIAPSDLESLRRTFGEASVADFSGVNPLTIEVHNYYEDSHYRPTVARTILGSLYPRARSGVAPSGFAAARMTGGP